LKPELIKKEKILEHPLVVFLQDNTSSITSGSDSVYYKNTYLQYLDSLSNLQDINIDFVPFDNKLQKKIDFNGDITNISSVLNQVSNNYSNLNIGAYILATDGIYNEGFNPLYSTINLNAPLYTVLLGDTVQHKDAFISSIRNNKITHLNNQSPVEVLIGANQLNGSELVFEVFNHLQDPQHIVPICRQIIDVNNSNDAHRLKFFISSDKPGLQSYYVRLQSNASERNLSNNSKMFFIDVIDDRKKILLLFSSPHPDVGAIKESLESYDQYEVHTYWCSRLNNHHFDNTKTNDYSLIIAHQLSNSEICTAFPKHQNQPIWHIVGSNTDLYNFNNMQNFVQFQKTNNSFEFSHVALNKNFSSFIVNDSLSDFLSFSTPFLTPFSDFSINYFSDALLHKKIGSLNTERPILFFVENDYKSAFLLGEGLWRWRLNDTYLNDSNNLFNSLISKIVQNLLLDEDKKRFHVNYNAVQHSSQRVFFEAELYNKNFELVNSYDVDIDFVDSLGHNYNYKFTAIDDYYFLDINLGEGEYDFIAKAQIGNEVFTKKGNLVISDFNLESRDLVADYSLLLDLANMNNGRLVPKDSLHQLINQIAHLSSFKTRSYYNYSYHSLINFEIVLLLILITLFLEWLIRRRYINY